MTGEMILGYFFDNHRKRAGVHVRETLIAEPGIRLTWYTHGGGAGLLEPVAFEDIVVCDRPEDVDKDSQF